MDLIQYYSTDIWNELGDPRAYHLPLMSGGPFQVVAVVAFYIVFVNWLGPWLMRKREPFELRIFMFIYNCYLIGMNGVGFLCGLWITDFGARSWDCSPLDYNSTRFKDRLMLYFGWMYFLTKFLDWMDTIFFILRKKQHQASFLHVFHHAAMPLVGWFGLKFHPGPLSSFLPLINVYIHAVMYTYYAMACSGSELKKHLWWKKYITQMQLVQFVTTFIHAFYAFFTPNCCWPKWLALAEMCFASAFFNMFFAFYRVAYCGKNKEQNKLCSNDKNNNTEKLDKKFQ